ncbi:unnamed protein product, partial [Urochloa humidicola]
MKRLTGSACNKIWRGNKHGDQDGVGFGEVKPARVNGEDFIWACDTEIDSCNFTPKTRLPYYIIKGAWP